MTSRSRTVQCKAATNVPGDLSGDSSGMTQYEKIIETLTTLFPLWVCFIYCINSLDQYDTFYLSLNEC